MEILKSESMGDLLQYKEFLKSKVIAHSPCGFDADLSHIEWLFPWQQKTVELSLKRGRAAIFAGIGLGKTRQQLAWADLVHRTTGVNVIVFVPLAVAPQTVGESAKLKGSAEDLGIAVNICKSQSDVKPGINISNYEKMHLFDSSEFGAIVLDESSVLKGYSSATRELLGQFAANIPYRLACTATPAPNDLIEIINHAEWLGIMNGKEAIANFFVQDGNTTKKYRLKKTCIADFWRWVASWAVCVRKPSDLGDFSDEGYDLPELRIHEVEVESDRVMESLLPVDALDMSERRAIRKESLNYRVSATANLVNNSTDKWVVWCDYNDESDALRKAIPDAAEVRGSMTTEQKEKAIADFTWGDRRVLISKASMTGFGLNWQHCHKTVFVGVSDSWEQQYQAIGRFYRFGQKHPVDVYMVASLQESVVTQNLKRKQAQSDDFYSSVKQYMQQALEGVKKVESTVTNGYESGTNWQLYQGDNVDRIKEIPDDSIGSIITSIPFPGMYAYTDLPEDMGNVSSYQEFTDHISFLVPELMRVLKPGRSACIHLCQGVAMKSRDGHMGLKDFRGDIIRLFQKFDFVYAGEVSIQKDPQLEAIRNNTHGLLFKSLSTDASIMRMCLLDYVVIFRKPGKSFEPIKAGKSKKYNPGGGWITEEEWIEWADGVWYRHIAPNSKTAAMHPYHPALTRKAMQTTRGGSEPLNGIMATDVMNVSQARDVNDERHLCPLQMGVIERCAKLFSNPGDTILDPFNGIGSSGVKAIEIERKYIGLEVKDSYCKSTVKNLKEAESGKSKKQLTIFDVELVGSIA